MKVGILIRRTPTIPKWLMMVFLCGCDSIVLLLVMREQLLSINNPL